MEGTSVALAKLLDTKLTHMAALLTMRNQYSVRQKSVSKTSPGLAEQFVCDDSRIWLAVWPGRPSKPSNAYVGGTSAADIVRSASCRALTLTVC